MMFSFIQADDDGGLIGAYSSRSRIVPFFLRAQEVRQRSFLWWCAPSNKDYNTADEDQKDKIIQDLRHRWGKTYQ